MKKSQLAIAKSQWLISLSGLSALNVVQCLLSVWSSFNHPLTPLLDWTGHMGLCSSIVRGYFSFLPQRFMFVLFILFIELNTSHGNSEENLFRVLFTQDKQTVKSFPQASNWGCYLQLWSLIPGQRSTYGQVVAVRRHPIVPLHLLLPRRLLQPCPNCCWRRRQYWALNSNCRTSLFTNTQSVNTVRFLAFITLLGLDGQADNLRTLSVSVWLYLRCDLGELCGVLDGVEWAEELWRSSLASMLWIWSFYNRNNKTHCKPLTSVKM